MVVFTSYAKSDTILPEALCIEVKLENPLRGGTKTTRPPACKNSTVSFIYILHDNLWIH
jgi:hypothetical protein